jgi:hypothetical protein
VNRPVEDVPGLQVTAAPIDGELRVRRELQERTARAHGELTRTDRDASFFSTAIDQITEHGNHDHDGDHDGRHGQSQRHARPFGRGAAVRRPRAMSLCE